MSDAYAGRVRRALRHLLRSRAERSAARRRAELERRLLPALTEEDRQRFALLREARADIAAHRTEGLAEWFRQVLAQLDRLLERYLLFAARKVEYRRFIVELAITRARLDGRELRLPGTCGRTADLESEIDRAAREVDADILLDGVLKAYRAEIRRLDESLARERDEATAGIARMNRDILARSLAQVERIQRLLRNLDQQLELVANTFNLINSQVRTSMPEQVLEEVDAVVDQSDVLARTLQEFVSVEEPQQTLVRRQGE